MDGFYDLRLYYFLFCSEALAIEFDYSAVDFEFVGLKYFGFGLKDSGVVGESEYLVVEVLVCVFLLQE